MIVMRVRLQQEGEIFISRIKISLDQSIKGGWNEIDAVELVGTTADGTLIRQWATNASASSQYNTTS